MRVIYPERINKLIDIVAPYMEYVPEKGMVLREDAPPEVVAARRELDDPKNEIKGY